MNSRSVIGVAFVLQVLLGNVCLIDLAQAMAPASPEEVPMSREEPLSRERLTCPWTSPADAGAPDASSPCESGKCMTNPAPDVPCHPAALQAADPVTLPAVALEAAVPPVHPDAPRPAQAAGPPPSALAGVVLRC